MDYYERDLLSGLAVVKLCSDSTETGCGVGLSSSIISDALMGRTVYNLRLPLKRGISMAFPKDLYEGVTHIVKYLAKLFCIGYLFLHKRRKPTTSIMAARMIIVTTTTPATIPPLPVSAWFLESAE